MRRIAGSVRETSTMVDSTPTRHGAAVEHDVDVVAKIGAHVGRGGRADAPETIGRRRRDATAELLEQRERNGLIRAHGSPTVSRPPVTTVGDAWRAAAAPV